MVDPEKLLETEESALSVDDLLKAYYEYFQCPMVVIDGNYEIISYFYIDDVDETFEQNIRRGSWSVELISIANASFEEEAEYKIITSINSKLRRLFYRITDRGRIFGYLVLLENRRVPFENLDFSLLKHLAKSVGKMIYLRSGENGDFSQLGFWKALVDRAYANREIFLQKAKECGIDLTRDYRMLLISLTHYRNAGDSFLESSLRSILPEHFLLVKGRHIVLIFSRKIGDFAIRRLNDFLFQNQLYAVLGSGIADLYETDVILGNLIKLCDYLEKSKNEYSVQKEEDYKLLLPLFNAENDGVILNYIDEVILRIYRYDRENETEMNRTIYLYLLHNKSLNETGRLLYVHKNTVIYRLERAKDLFGIGFDDGAKNLSYLYSLTILDYLRSIGSEALSAYRGS